MAVFVGAVGVLLIEVGDHGDQQPPLRHTRNDLPLGGVALRIAEQLPEPRIRLPGVTLEAGHQHVCAFEVRHRCLTTASATAAAKSLPSGATSSITPAASMSNAPTP